MVRIASFLVVLLAGCAVVRESEAVSEFSVPFKWTNIEFGFSKRQELQHSIAQGFYQPETFKRIGMVDVDYDSSRKPRYFISFPRTIPGTPYTLATITDKFGPNGPIVKPYPDLSWHASYGANCDEIVSVFRFFIDECNRLWVLDFVFITDNAYPECPFKILVFDLKTDRLIRRYVFPDDQSYPDSAFSTIVVDYPGSSCHNAKVLIGDARGAGILVYDWKKDRSWRIDNDLLEYEPAALNIKIAGETFPYPDGIYTIALSPNHFKDRYLYFHGLASFKKNRVPLWLIYNETIWTENRNAYPDAFETYAVEDVHSAGSAMDSYGNLYTSLAEPITFVSWDIRKPYNSQTVRVVGDNQNTLQFASSMKVVRNREGKEELWAATVRLQKLALGTTSEHEVNFRIVACAIEDLNKNRNCSVFV